MTKITKELLLTAGWKETGDGVVPIKKVLMTVKDDEDHPDTVSLILHKYNNFEQYAIALPDGALIDLNISGLEDLIKVEKLLASYNPAY